MDSALKEQARAGETVEHRLWLAKMLSEYYDPMYDYQQSKRERQVLMSGDFSEVLAYLNTTR